jgi:hypothetical protein
MRHIVIAAAISAFIWVSNAQAQPVTTFAEVAGRWSGVGSRGGTTDITIRPDGTFVSESPLGRITGTARIEDGILILPRPENQGQAKLTRTGDVLAGPYTAGTLTGTTRVTRVR